MSTDDIPALSRRHLLGAVGALGVATAAGAVGVAAAASPERPVVADDGAGPLVVHVRDLHSGTLDVFQGTSFRQVRDPELAARLSRAAQA